MSATSSRGPAAPAVAAALLPLIAVVFIAILVIGLALPVLPLHVHQGLGLGTFVVGLVAGAQFSASLLSRLGAGDYADRRGAKRAVLTGLLVAAGVTKEVTFEPVNGPINDRIDEAYRAKYGDSPYLGPMIGARAATVEVMPRE